MIHTFIQQPHAGRTQAQCIETLGYDALCNRSRLSPVIANVSWR